MDTNSVTLRIDSPVALFLVTMLIFLLWFPFAPIVVTGDFEAEAIGVSATYILLFAMGLAAGGRRFHAVRVDCPMAVNRIDRLIRLVLLGGGVGLVLRIYDRVVVRGGGALSLFSYASNRELVEASGGGGIAIIGSALAPSLFFLPLLVFLRQGAGRKRRTDLLLLGVAAIYPLLELALLGSRSALLIFGAMFVFAAVTCRPDAVRLRNVLGVLVLGVALASGFSYAFWDRAVQLGIDPIASTYLSGYAYLAPASDQAVATLSAEAGSAMASVLFGFLHISQYAFHGYLEFLLLLQEYDGSLTFGLRTLYIPAKLVWIGSGPIEQFFYDNSLRSGVYTTFFGPLVYDFGRIGGLLASFVLGYLLAFPSRAIATRRRLSWLFVYVPVMAMVPFALMVNWLVSGTGQYVVISGLALLVLTKWRWCSLNPRSIPTSGPAPIPPTALHLRDRWPVAGTAPPVATAASTLHPLSSPDPRFYGKQ